jgi:hypothetical protein
MKMKLLLFVGLIAGSLGLSLLFAAPTYAAGETYKWINDTTIEGSGGAYDSKIVKNVQSGTTTATRPVGKVTFVRDGTTNQFKAADSNIFYTIPASGGRPAGMCNLQLSLTASTISSATLATNSGNNASCNDSTLTTSGIAIGATDAGPDPQSILDAAKPAAPAEGATNKASTCKIDAVGWLLCPVMDLTAKIVDGAYGFVASLMKIAPITTDKSDSAKAMYEAWSIMRNFANVAFVIAFMAIIFSQMTSVGLSNYGIKKMLPRLIVAAILVNASYWICAIAVDISNILGASLNSLFSSAIPALNAADRAAFTAEGATSGGWQGIVGAVLAGTLVAGAILYVTLSALVPALLAALLAILTVFVVLTLRQALIILLIVVSPLAFVAYLLPNTESLFKKWLGLFKTLLIMYPIIAMIFGASALASTIVMASATGTYAVAIQIMGALISIIPLALTPIIMKTAGGVLNRVGAFVNNPNKGPVDRLRKGVGSWQKNQKVNRQLRAMDPEKFSMPGRRAAMNFGNKRRAINSGRADQLEQMQKEQIAKLATADDGSFARQVAGNAPGKAELYQAKQASYLASVDPVKIKLEVDKSQVDNMVGTLKLSVKDPANMVSEVQTAFNQAVSSGDVIKARAAQEILKGAGDRGKTALRESLRSVDSTSEVGTELRKDLASSDAKSWSADTYAWAVDQNHRSIDEISKDAKTYSNLSEAQVAGQIKPSLEAAIAKKGISTETATAVLASRAAEQMGVDQKKILMQYAGTATPTGTPNQQYGNLNIPHGANPGNSRTPPANLGGNPGPNGIIIPGNNQNNNQP